VATPAPQQPSPTISPPKRAIAFVDGQNLFYASREAFGYDYPNYHPLALADHICAERGWRCEQVRFYTGVPKLQDNPFWHNFWAAKKRFLKRDKRVEFFSRDTHYRDKPISLQGGCVTDYSFGRPSTAGRDAAFLVIR
jgi:hypothetical protein